MAVFYYYRERMIYLRKFQEVIEDKIKKERKKKEKEEEKEECYIIETLLFLYGYKRSRQCEYWTESE